MASIQHSVNTNNGGLHTVTMPFAFCRKSLPEPEQADFPNPSDHEPDDDCQKSTGDRLVRSMGESLENQEQAEQGDRPPKDKGDL